MNKKKLFSKIILGGAQFGLNYGVSNNHGKISNLNKKNIINYAKNIGIKSIDLAASYGDNHKFASSYLDNSWYIYTKFEKKKSNLLYINKKLKELKFKPEAIFFHSYKDYCDDNFYKKILLICKKKKIKKIGVSIYNQSELIKILKKGYPNIIQLPLNLINQKPISMNLIKKLKRNKVEIFARSIFLQGLFFLSSKDMVIQNKNIMNEIFRINMILKKNKLKFADASLTWVFNQKYVDKIIIGITKKKELEQNINYLKFGDKKFLNKKKVIDSLKLNDKRIIDPRYWILKKKNKKIVLDFKKNI